MTCPGLGPLSGSESEVMLRHVEVPRPRDADGDVEQVMLKCRFCDSDVSRSAAEPDGSARHCTRYPHA